MIRTYLSRVASYVLAGLIFFVVAKYYQQLPLPILCVLLAVGFFAPSTSLVSLVVGQDIFGMLVYFSILSFAMVILVWLSGLDSTIAIGTFVVFLVPTTIYCAVIYWLAGLIRGLPFDMQV